LISIRNNSFVVNRESVLSLTRSHGEAGELVEDEGAGGGGGTDGKGALADVLDLLGGVGGEVTVAVLIEQDRQLLVNGRR